MSQDDKFIKNIRTVLDSSVEQLDSETAQRLSRMKYRALEQQPQQRSGLFWKGAMVTFSLALVVVFLAPLEDRGGLPLSTQTEIGILTATEPLDFYREDIEFYEWLSEVLEDEQNSVVEPASAVLDATFPDGAGQLSAGAAEYGPDRISRNVRG